MRSFKTASVFACFLILAVFFQIFFAKSVNAATITSTATGGNWNAGGSWSGGSVPGSADDAVIAPGATITVTDNRSVNSVAFSNSGSSASTLSVNTGIGLTVTTSITRQNAATLSTTSNISGAGSISAASVAVGNATTPTSGAQTTTLNSSITTLIVSGNVTVNSYRATAARYNNGTFALSGGTLTVSGTVSTVPAASPTNSAFTVTNATLILKGSTPWSQGGAGGTNTITLNNTGAVVNYQGSSSQTVLGKPYTTLKCNNSSGCTLGAAATVTTLTVGDITSSSVMDDGGYQIISTGTLNLSSGTFKIGGSSATYFPAFSTNNITAGTTVEYDSTAAQNVSATPSYSNITITGASTKTLQGTTTVGGNLTINSGATLATGNNNMTVSGNWTNNGGTFTPGSGTVTFNGTGAQAINGSAASQTFYNVTLSKTAGTALSVSGSTTALTVQDLTETTGDFNPPASLTINGTFTHSAGTLTAGTNIYAKGDWTRNGGTFTANSGTVTFNGSGTQTISGTTSFYGLAITASAVRTVNFADASTTSVLANGSLTFTGADSSNRMILRSVSNNASNYWYLQVSATNTTVSVTNCAVSYSNATGYKQIDASGGTNLDNGNNPNWTFGATGPTKVVFTNGANTVYANQCSGTGASFTIQLQNAGSTPTNPLATTVIGITTDSSGTFTIYSDSGCSSQINPAQISFSTSENTKSFYIKDTKKSPTTWTMTAARVSGDSVTSDTDAYTVDPYQTSAILVVLPNQTFTDGSGVSGSPSFTGTRTPNATAGTAYSVDLKAVDANNNLVNRGTYNYNGSKTISWSNSTAGNAPSGQGPSFPGSVTFTNGTAATLSITYYNAATGRTVRADDTGGAINGTASTSFTVQANVANNYAVAASTPQTAGSAFNVTVTARDQWNNNLGALYSAPAGTYVWSTTAGNAPSGQTPSIGTLAQANFSSGVATKSVTLYKAESGVTFTASEPSPSTVTGTSNTVTVNVGSLQNYEVVAATPQTAGVCFTGTNTVKARDTWNNYVTSDASTVNMTSNGTVTFYSAAGCTGGTETTQYTLSSGNATMYVKTNIKSTTLTVTATHNSLGYTGTSSAITVNPAAANTILVVLPNQSFTDGSGVSGSPSFSGANTPDATAGTAFSVDLKAVDAFNNLVNTGPNNYTGAKTISWSNSTAGNAPSGQGPSFPGSVTFTNGTAATLSITYYNAATGRTVRADDTGGAINGTASSTFNVDAGTVSTLATDSTVTGSATATTGIPLPITVTLKDAWRNPVQNFSSASITITATATTSNITQPSANTDASGATTGSVTWSDTGSKTLGANISGVGTLASTLGVTANDPTPTSAPGTVRDRINGGTKIRGGAKL